MTRPVFRWLLFTLCLAVFTGAMVWISLRTLDLEDQRCQNEEEAQVQEKLRLALWRMDSLASTLLIRENARPASHYQTFYVPDDLFTPDNDAVPRGEALMPSPLMGSPPDLVLLHFELLKNQPGVCSPQAPEGQQREMAMSWYAIKPDLAQGSRRLADLQSLLGRHPELQTWPRQDGNESVSTSTAPPPGRGNSAALPGYLSPADPFSSLPPAAAFNRWSLDDGLAKNTPPAAEPEDKELAPLKTEAAPMPQGLALVGSDKSPPQPAITQEEPLPAQNGMKGQTGQNLPAQGQLDFSNSERAQRSIVVSNALAMEKAEALKVPQKKTSVPKPAEMEPSKPATTTPVVAAAEPKPAPASKPPPSLKSARFKEDETLAKKPPATASAAMPAPAAPAALAKQNEGKLRQETGKDASQTRSPAPAPPASPAPAAAFSGTVTMSGDVATPPKKGAVPSNGRPTPGKDSEVQTAAPAAPVVALEMDAAKPTSQQELPFLTPVSKAGDAVPQAGSATARGLSGGTGGLGDSRLQPTTAAPDAARAPQAPVTAPPGVTSRTRGFGNQGGSAGEGAAAAAALPGATTSNASMTADTGAAAPAAAPAPPAATPLPASPPADESASSPVSLLSEVADRYSRRSPAAAPTPPKTALPSIAGDLRPTWLEGELFLLRPATLDGRARIQGVWLDWPRLQERLLETIRDLLPEARLVAAPPGMAGTDPSTLVTLPIQLISGTVPVDRSHLGSLLRPALALAWICLISAALAVAFVLHRAMLLSERRASFVSAVTHELRTPLTTFRLYSEMLADEMVPDPERRRGYLQTLCDEATRLMHLVENVLSYSRIERGRTAARTELVAVGPVLERVIPRLRQHCEQRGLKFVSDWKPELDKALFQVDVLAVEQILFNLTDNACKYAAPDSQPPELKLHARLDGASIYLEMRDHGPGLAAAQKKKLFQPFAKSATEAAHSAPGVGLGLALCRRLARELGGDLTYHEPEGRGAAFILRIPRAPSRPAEDDKRPE